MAAEFELDVEMYDDLEEHLPSGCEFTMDELVMFACGDGFFVMD